MKVEVIRGWPQRFQSVELTLPAGAVIADAMSSDEVQAAAMTEGAEVAYAIHGQRAEATTGLRDGDRIELLRPLQVDPKDARRRRASARIPG